MLLTQSSSVMNTNVSLFIIIFSYYTDNPAKVVQIKRNTKQFNIYLLFFRNMAQKIGRAKQPSRYKSLCNAMITYS